MPRDLIREYEMGLISFKTFLRLSNPKNMYDQYEAGRIHFNQLSACVKKPRAKTNKRVAGSGNLPEKTVHELGRIAGQNLTVPDSRLGGRFGSNVELRRAKDRKLDNATKHTDLEAEMR